MIYVISKETFGSYNVRDIQCNANWCSCPYSDYALIPDNMVDGILATKGYCDITLNSAGTEVTAFTARSIPSVPEECCGMNTVLNVNGVSADSSGTVTLVTDLIPLWKNASSGATFAAQGIEIDTTPYKMLVIELDGDVSGSLYTSMTMVNAYPGSKNYVAAVKRGSPNSIIYRTVTVYSDEVRIGDAYVAIGSSDNTEATPIGIYGIK